MNTNKSSYFNYSLNIGCKSPSFAQSLEVPSSLRSVRLVSIPLYLINTSVSVF